MSNLEKNLTYAASELDAAILPPYKVFARGNSRLKRGLIWGKENSIFFLINILSFLIKSILFLGLINNDNTARFDWIKALFSFSTLPPFGVYICFGIMLFSFAFLFSGQARFRFIIVANIFYSLLLVSDLMYYRGFNSFLSPYLLSETSNLDNLTNSVLSMLRLIDVSFVLDILIFLVFHKKLRKFHLRARRNVLVLFLLLTLSVSYIYFQHIRMDYGGKGILFRIAWSPNQTMTDLSPLGYHAFDIYNYVNNKQSQKISPQENKEIADWFSQNKENLPPNKYQGMFKGQNLIIIQVESLENFVINQKINGQEITPNLNKLLSNSLYFPNFYEQVYNGTSSDADLMTNTSVYPVRTGSTFFRFPDNTYNSLPKILQSQGYSTIAIHPDKGSYWNWEPALSAIGFSKTVDASHFNTDEKIGLGISDGSYLKQVAPILMNQKQPFYSFMVTLSSHSPFDLPAKYRDLKLSDSLNQTKLGGYFQSINYTDRQIGDFLSTLDKHGILDNSVVVIYGDHTAIHKYYDDEVKQVKPQQSWWLDDSKRIPLIIYDKGMVGEKINTIGGQIDTMPTIASLLGVNQEKYTKTAFGRNLLNTNENFVVLANRQYIGSARNENEKENRIKGIDLADLIITKNYYKQMGYK